MKRFNENICCLELENELKVLKGKISSDIKSGDIEKAISRIILKRFEKTTVELKELSYKSSEKIFNANGILTSIKTQKL